MKTVLNNILLPTLFQTLNNIVEPESGVTILFNTVNSLEQCGQQNIVQYCFHQLATSCSFWLIFCCVPLKYLVSGVLHENKEIVTSNDVNLAKICHVFYYNLLTDVVLEHILQIYSKAQCVKHPKLKFQVTVGSHLNMRTLSLCSSPFPRWTSAHYQLCVNIRLLCMRVQNK